MGLKEFLLRASDSLARSFISFDKIKCITGTNHASFHAACCSSDKCETSFVAKHTIQWNCVASML